MLKFSDIEDKLKTFKSYKRRIRNIEDYIKSLRENNCETTSAIEFINEFQGIIFMNPKTQLWIHIYSGTKLIDVSEIIKMEKLSHSKISPVGTFDNTALGNIIIYITEKNQFYVDRGYKIADSIEEFWNVAFSDKLHFPVIISPKTYEVMENAGWYKGRKIDTEPYINLLKEKQIPYIDKAVEFYAEFGELKCKSGFDRNAVLDTSLSSTSINYILKGYSRKKFAHVEELYNESVAPVGVVDGFAILVSESGKVYLESMVKCGDNALEAMNTMLR